MACFSDITTETRPFGVSSLTVPEASGNYCGRGAGRFGTHSSHENFTPIYYKRVMFFAHFNAGVRAVDIRDPFHPRRSRTTFRLRPAERRAPLRPAAACKGIQTNNVEVDDRGYVYAADRTGTGLHILELSGDARKVANFQ